MLSLQQKNDFALIISNARAVVFRFTQINLIIGVHSLCVTSARMFQGDLDLTQQHNLLITYHVVQEVAILTPRYNVMELS